MSMGICYRYIGYRLSDDNIKMSADCIQLHQVAGRSDHHQWSDRHLVRNTLDDSMFPSMGSKNSVSVTYTGGFLQGTTSFTKTNVNTPGTTSLPLEWYLVFTGRRVICPAMTGRMFPFTKDIRWWHEHPEGTRTSDERSCHQRPY